MILYPVMDLLGGIVVRAAGGDRARYKPVQSVLVDSTDPLRVAGAFRERLGLERLYVADLDALQGREPARGVLATLHAGGFKLLVDAGARSATEALAILEAGAAEVIAPLESLPGPEALASIVSHVGPERTVFSLDLKNGIHLGNRTGWKEPEAASVAREAYRSGARRILLLDLAQVGSARGPAHVELFRNLSRELRDVSFLIGGGVRSRADLGLLEAAGVQGVLVASALHDGAITRRDLSADETDGHGIPAPSLPRSGAAADK